MIRSMIPALVLRDFFMTRQAAGVVGGMVARRSGSRWAVVIFRDAAGKRRIIFASR